MEKLKFFESSFLNANTGEEMKSITVLINNVELYQSNMLVR